MDLSSEIDYEDDLGSVGLDGSPFYTRVDPVANRGALRLEQLDSVIGFRETMRALASGVVLVTTYVGGRPWGVTVTSCCSLSVEPPRLLVSLMRNTVSFKTIEIGGCFGVDLLGDAHKRLAQSGAAPGQPKFIEPAALAEAPPGIRSPVVSGSLSHVDCEVERVFDGGDHAIIVGSVLAVSSVRPHSSASPLLYFEGGFYHLGGAL
jgi:flavin reductase ActVB